MHDHHESEYRMEDLHRKILFDISRHLSIQLHMKQKMDGIIDKSN
jgi:hypothetical protein